MLQLRDEVYILLKPGLEMADHRGPNGDVIVQAFVVVLRFSEDFEGSIDTGVEIGEEFMVLIVDVKK